MKRNIIIAAVIMLATTVGFSQDNDRRKMAHGQKAMHSKSEKGDRHERFAQMLELTEEQQKQIADIRFKSMKSVKTLHNNLREKSARLNTLSTADNPDTKAITKVAEEIGDIKSRIFVNQVLTRQEIRALLDEKQQFKFDQMQKMMRARGPRGKEHHRKG